jgi:hypothetical protein
MSGKPFHVGGVINLADGEETKDIQSPKIAKDRLFVVEFVGVNGIVQQNQTLFVSLEIYTNSVPGIYPIFTTGTSTVSDPVLPARRFGSQRVLLYADPDSQIIVTTARHNGNAAARVFVDISGRLVKPWLSDGTRTSV